MTGRGTGEAQAAEVRSCPTCGSDNDRGRDLCRKCLERIPFDAPTTLTHSDMRAMSEDDTGSPLAQVHDRYVRCAERIWALFPKDPLGDDPAHAWIERLEALLDRGLLHGIIEVAKLPGGHALTGTSLPRAPGI